MVTTGQFLKQSARNCRSCIESK